MGTSRSVHGTPGPYIRQSFGLDSCRFIGYRTFTGHFTTGRDESRRFIDRSPAVSGAEIRRVRGQVDPGRDARGIGQYRNAHVYGAVSSPADFESAGGTVPGWPTDERIVTYCGCPHHLSSIRAAGLQKVGVETVYALDEGFLGQADSWKERGYPMAGTIFVEEGEAAVRSARITGTVDPQYAGSYVWATAGQQYEAAPVAADGSYDLHLRVSGLDPDTTVTVRTPAGTETASLATLV
jgi:rhodanese-related sulfurtransferase